MKNLNTQQKRLKSKSSALNNKFKATNKVLIVGGGKSGEGAKKLLLTLGFPSEIIDTTQRVDISNYGFKKVIVSPGVITNGSDKKVEKFLKPFRMAGIKLVSEVNFALENAKGNFIAITGTNGKTTTTFFVEHLLNGLKQKAKAVGNCGVVFSGVVADEINKMQLIQSDKINERRKEINHSENGDKLDINNQENAQNYIIELSSFMLELPLEKKLDVAAILNFGTGHENYHGSNENYLKAKLNIIDAIKPNGKLVLNYDEEVLKQSVIDKIGDNNQIKEKDESLLNNTYYFSIQKKVKGIFLNDDDIIFSHDGKNEQKLFSINGLKIKGEHNKQNAIASLLIVLLSLQANNQLDIKNIDRELISQIELGVSGFKGVKHRQSEVRAVNGKVFINDSKATNIKSCLAALKVFSGKVTLILCGKSKKEDFKILFQNIPSNVSKIVLCGGITNEVIRAAKTFNWQIDKSFVDANSNICEVNDKGFNYNNLTENELKKCQHKTKTIFVAKNFNDAVVISNLISTVGTTVLLSPAAPSYDEFKNFEERGDRFEEIVNKLK